MFRGSVVNYTRGGPGKAGLTYYNWSDVPITSLPNHPDDSEHASILWRFLAPHQSPAPADAIFVFGGVNLRVPERAAELFQSDYASTVLVSGGAGVRTHLHFDQPEADVFVQVLKERGVPSDAIVFETAATNTGENVQLGMAKLLPRVHEISSLVLVSTPFIMRRCIATFERQYPQIDVFPCPPIGSYQEFVDRPYPEFIDRLVAEVDRLDAYSEAGFIAPVDVPSTVRDACEHFRKNGFSVST